MQPRCISLTVRNDVRAASSRYRRLRRFERVDGCLILRRVARVEAAAERDSAQEAAEVGVGGAVVRSGHGDLFFDLFIGGDSEGPGGDGQGDEGEEGGELHGVGF